MGLIFQQEDKTNMLAAAIKKHGACFHPMFPDMICLKTRPVTLWLWRFSAGNEDIMECMVG